MKSQMFKLLKFACEISIFSLESIFLWTCVCIANVVKFHTKNRRLNSNLYVRLCGWNIEIYGQHSKNLFGIVNEMKVTMINCILYNALAFVCMCRTHNVIQMFDISETITILSEERGWREKKNAHTDRNVSKIRMNARDRSHLKHTESVPFISINWHASNLNSVTLEACTTVQTVHEHTMYNGGSYIDASERYIHKM